jgi:transcriptional regulator with XRE-family HTH domain
VSFGQGLREWRLSQGLTQRAVAQKCGVKAPLICDYESGRRQPSLAQLMRVAAALEAWPCELLGRPCPPTQIRAKVVELRSQVDDLGKRLDLYERHEVGQRRR